MKHRERMIELLRRFAAQGKTLEWCTGRLVMRRSRKTLERYCRLGGIEFPDYKPRKRIA